MKSVINNLGMGTAGSISLAVLLVVWEVLCRLLGVREIMLPLPSQIFVELWDNLLWYLDQSLYTLLTTLAGFLLSVIVGVLIAIGLVSSRLFERFLYPLIIGFNSVPKVALAPLFVVWLGTGAEPKVAIAFLIAVFAIIVDSVHGLRSVPPDITDLGRVLRGSAWDFFFKVKLPSALPSMVAGMKVAMSLALVGAIVGEFVASQMGLGYVIMSAQGTFDTVRVFAALFLLAIMGLALYGAVALVERKATPWRQVERDN
ncbi:MAG: ABC transporter permease [Burkholderiaceae bacterium]|nr:MAG: ABC transporter permease [Burkholderiaceae bacterium]